MKTRLSSVALLLVVALSAVGSRATECSPSEKYYIGYDLSFSTTITNRGSSVIHMSSNRLTTPLIYLFQNDTTQTIRLTSHSHSIKTGTDPDGNLIGIFQVEEALQPGQSIKIEANFRAHLYLTSERQFAWKPELDYSASGLKNEIPKELADKYCAQAGPWRIDEPTPSWQSVRELAFNLAKNETNILKAVMELVTWVGMNIKYPTTRRDRILSPNETLSLREGDCDEQANLIISLCRVLGIPAYLQSGCMFLPARTDKGSKFDGRFSFHLDRVGWHAWAMVYIPPWRWIPVDMTMGYSKEYPLLAIEAAAIQTFSAVMSNNHLVTDYVSETNRDGERLKRTDVYIEERQTMKTIAISSEYQATENVSTSTLVLVAFGMIVIGVYVVVRHKAKRKTRRVKS